MADKLNGGDQLPALTLALAGGELMLLASRRRAKESDQ